MILAVLSFVQAQEEYSVFSNGLTDIVEYISNAGYEDVTFTDSGVKITYDIKYSGYTNMGTQGFLLKLEDDDRAECSVKFSMELLKK